MLSGYHTEGLLLLAIIPAAVAVFWIFHAVLRLRRSNKSYLTFWIMFTGLPVAGILLFFWSVLVPTDYLGIASISGPGFQAMTCTAVAFIVWVVARLREIAIQVILGAMDPRKAKLSGG